MIPNSRPVTKNIAFGSAIPASTRVADSYSDSLMDDLFLDVDKILDGDLSSYMTVVSKPKPASPSTRTVQLPSNFVPKSAADIYRATMAAGPAATTPTPIPARSQPHATRQPAYQPHATTHGKYGGGRPVTAVKPAVNINAAQAGNFHSNVVHAGEEVVSAGLYGTTIDLQRVVDPSDSPIQSVSNYLYPSHPLPELTLANASPRPPQTIFEPNQRQRQTVSLPFLLMGAASISAAGTMGLWVASHSSPGNNWLLSLSQEASAAELPSNSDEEFLAYLQQSLEVIRNRQDEVAKTVAVVPAPQGLPALPTVVPNTNTPQQAGVLPNLPGVAPATSVIERVFVPVYQNAPAAPTQVASAVSVPNVATPSSAPRPIVPVPAPVAAAAAIPQGAPVAATASVPIVVPTATQAPTTLPVPTAIAVAPTNAAAAITNIAPNSEHVLVGILNLGSRSAALFDLEGTAQRAYVGDRIGTSSWTLVSVNGQDVVVRRDGEVRSIYIGQRF